MAYIQNNCLPFKDIPLTQRCIKTVWLWFNVVAYKYCNDTWKWKEASEEQSCVMIREDDNCLMLEGETDALEGRIKLYFQLCGQGVKVQRFISKPSAKTSNKFTKTQKGFSVTRLLSINYFKWTRTVFAIQETVSRSTKWFGDFYCRNSMQIQRTQNGASCPHSRR